MLSLYSRVGLTTTRQSLFRPCLIRGIKTIPQPPGFIVGTVNDAYVPPAPKKIEGSLHWTSERAVAIGLVPLVMAPFLTGASTIVDSTMCGFLLYHSFTGFQSCIIDYIPERVYGSIHKFCIYLLTLGTGVAGYGVYQIENKEGGLSTILSKLWKA